VVLLRKTKEQLAPFGLLKSLQDFKRVDKSLLK